MPQRLQRFCGQNNCTNGLAGWAVRPSCPRPSNAHRFRSGTLGGCLRRILTNHGDSRIPDFRPVLWGGRAVIDRCSPCPTCENLGDNRNLVRAHYLSNGGVGGHAPISLVSAASAASRDTAAGIGLFWGVPRPPAGGGGERRASRVVGCRAPR